MGEHYENANKREFYTFVSLDLLNKVIIFK